MEIAIVDGTGHIGAIRTLIQEYTDSLHRDLSFQHLQQELTELEKQYLPPAGRLLAAVTAEGETVGCVALRRLSPRRCEMKRLYAQLGFAEIPPYYENPMTDVLYMGRTLTGAEEKI